MKFYLAKTINSAVYKDVIENSDNKQTGWL